MRQNNPVALDWQEAALDSLQAPCGALAAFARQGSILTCGQLGAGSGDSGTGAPYLPTASNCTVVTMHANAAYAIAQRIQTSSSAPQNKQLKALLMYSFMMSDAGSIAACKSAQSSTHRIDASRLPTWFTDLSEDNAKAATVPTMHASVPSSPSSDAMPGQEPASDEDDPDRPFRRLLAHAQRLGTGPAASDTSFKLYLHRIACGCGDANGGWPGAGAGFGEGSPFAGSFMGGGSSAFYPPPGGSGGVSFPLGGAGSSSLLGGPLVPGTSGPQSGPADDPSVALPAGGGSARRALDDLSGEALGLGLSGGDTGAAEGVSASDAAGSGPWAWVDPLLQCIHTLEVWAVTILGSTDVRGATAAIGKAEDSSRRLHRKAKEGWRPLVAWLCLKVLAQLFHVTMVLLATLARATSAARVTAGPDSLCSTPATSPTHSQLHLSRASPRTSPRESAPTPPISSSMSHHPFAVVRTPLTPPEASAAAEAQPHSTSQGRGSFDVEPPQSHGVVAHDTLIEPPRAIQRPCAPIATPPPRVTPTLTPTHSIASPLATSPSGYSSFFGTGGHQSGAAARAARASLQMHVERVTERGLSIASLLTRKLNSVAEFVLSKEVSERFGLKLDRDWPFWADVLIEMLGELMMPRTPDTIPDDPQRRGHKVVAALTFRKHLSTLFPSGHHLNDDYCQLLVGHYRVLARSLCRALAHVSARLPDPSSVTRTKSWVTFLLGWQSQASAPRLSNVVRHAHKLVALCNVLLTQTQVLQRMLPDNTECFTFLAGDIDARLFEGDIPSNMFNVWVDVTAKLLSVFKQFATLWRRVSRQLEGSSSAARLPERAELPDLANEMVRLALHWRMHVPTSTQAVLRPAFKRLAEANKCRSAINNSLSPHT
eukprot:jgi/Ulvmu1/9740/UM055_0080.1